MPNDYWSGKRVLVTGGHGFVGQHVVELLATKPLASLECPSSLEADLRQMEVCLKATKDIDVVIHLAAKVGGIGLNQAIPGEMFYDNLMIGTQLLEASRQNQVAKFVGIGTVCAYPKNPPVPFREEDLWNGYPEETNAAYGLAKKMLLVQGQAYRQQYGFNAIFLLPANMYGPGDNFDPTSSHVIPALIKKFTNSKTSGSKEVVVWGTGKATREFLYVKDAAEGILLATEHYDKPEPVNLGSSHEISIRDLASLIAKLTGFTGTITWDATKPDGQPRRKLDVSRAKSEFNFVASTPFETGLSAMISWYQTNH